VYNEYFSHLIDKNNTNKRFWTYIKSCHHDHSGASTPQHGGKVIEEESDKAETLNSMPLLDNSPHPALPGITISEKGVLKKLRQLNPRKVSGPDGID